MKIQNLNLNKTFLITLIFVELFFAPSVFNATAASDLASRNQLFYRGSTPFLWVGDTAWFLMHATLKNANTYLTNRQQKGFTVIHAGCIGWGNNMNIANDDGVTPFASGATNVGASRNSAYWTNIKNIINSADSKGVYIALLPMNANTAEENAMLLHNEQTAYNYGYFLGGYFTQKNIIWFLGGDSDITYKPLQSLTRALARGIADGNAGLSASLSRSDSNRNFNTTIISFHPSGSKSQSTSMVYNNDPWLDFNAIQTHNNRHEVFSMTQNDYQNKGKTVVMSEGRYFGKWGNNPPGTDHTIRQEAYWSFMAGGYYSYGSSYKFTEGQSTCCNSNVTATMNTSGVETMSIFSQFLKNRNWYDYKPDQSFIVSGASSGTTVNTAVLNGNKAAMLYLSTKDSNVTVNLKKLNSSTKIKVSRFNPATGAINTIGEYLSSGNHTFNTGGLSDAVILFEAGSSSLPGDFNGDNEVNTLDYEIMKREFLKTGTNFKSDMNKDNKVNTLDYELFRREFGKKK